MKITKDINLTIPEQFTKIAINCSGGADSSLLLYLLGHVIKDREVPSIKVVTAKNILIDHKLKQPDRVKRIIKRVQELHGYDYISEHIVHDIKDVHDRGDFIGSLYDRHLVDVMFAGVTMNPMGGPVMVEKSSGESVDIAKYGITERSRANKSSWFVSYNGITKHTGGFNAFCSPFNSVDKRTIASLYEHYGLVNSLLPLTRSCEGDEESTDEYTKVCGDCWWCLERKWAFGSAR